MKKHFRSGLLSLCVGVVAAAGFLLPGCGSGPNSNATNGTAQNGTTQNSLYSRVTSAGTIRCGYIAYPPGSFKDPNSGKLSGIFVETLEEAAKNLGLKVQWAEEVGWGTMIEGLKSGRYDMIGTPVWANSTRARQADFSTPLFYSGIGVYVRNSENRFNGANLAALNNPSVKLSTIDGEMSDIISKSDFARAKRVSLPQNADVAQALLSVSTNKADVTFVEPYIAAQFLKNNAGTVRNIVADKPIRVFPTTMMFQRGQPEFKAMLDTALQELINSGFVDRLISKYDPAGTVYRVNYPYRSAPNRR